ncbi:winged helix-turn-helix transcriptional regulator [Bradyrhizobium betae]|nr:helix-turn-helix domain-containing protein [Bradyrhizobium betae]
MCTIICALRAILQVWTKLIVWTFSPSLLSLRMLAAHGGDDMAKVIPVRTCPVAAFQKMISGKYKLRIVWDLKDGPRRYGEIRSGLLRGTEGSAEITPRVLSRELKALTESGLIDRKDFGEVPPKVEYRLTRKGKSFVPVVAAIREWGDRNLSVSAALAVAAE